MAIVSGLILVHPDTDLDQITSEITGCPVYRDLTVRQIPPFGTRVGRGVYVPAAYFSVLAYDVHHIVARIVTQVVGQCGISAQRHRCPVGLVGRARECNQPMSSHRDISAFIDIEDFHIVFIELEFRGNYSPLR